MNRAQLEQLPDIESQNSSAQYALVWYDHDRPSTLFRVVSTNMGTPSDQINNDTFRSWCQPFTVTPSNPIAKLLAAADEEFKIDYTLWSRPPYSLPGLDVRWFEVLDDERWYIVQLA